MSISVSQGSRRNAKAHAWLCSQRSPCSHPTWCNRCLPQTKIGTRSIRIDSNIWWHIRMTLVTVFQHLFRCYLDRSRNNELNAADIDQVFHDELKYDASWKVHHYTRWTYVIEHQNRIDYYMITTSQTVPVTNTTGEAQVLHIPRQHIFKNTA